MKRRRDDIFGAAALCSATMHAGALFFVPSGDQFEKLAQILVASVSAASCAFALFAIAVLLQRWGITPALSVSVSSLGACTLIGWLIGAPIIPIEISADGTRICGQVAGTTFECPTPNVFAVPGMIATGLLSALIAIALLRRKQSSISE